MRQFAASTMDFIKDSTFTAIWNVNKPNLNVTEKKKTRILCWLTGKFKSRGPSRNMPCMHAHWNEQTVLVISVIFQGCFTLIFHNIVAIVPGPGSDRLRNASNLFVSYSLTKLFSCLLTFNLLLVNKSVVLLSWWQLICCRALPKE